MNGAFYSDVSRDSFDPFKHFSRVLMQQGRVQLDADWNEQTDILLRYLRTLAGDMIGPFGGPITGSGFQITSPQQKEDGFSISSGHYYVDGMLIENPDVDEQGQPITASYKHQPYNPIPDDLPTTGEVLLLAYVDVWELQISFVQDDSIREVALGVNGPDTATRALVVWQVKTLDATNFQAIIQDIRDPKKKTEKIQNLKELTRQLKGTFVPSNRGLLRARARVDVEDPTNVCITPPEARYRGAENQLYRVEIHNGGSVGSASGSDTPRRTGARRASGAKASVSDGEGTTSPTFKWSREDASVVFPIDNIEGTLITLANRGRDEHLGLAKDDWVEVVDDDYVLQVFRDPNHPNAQPNPLLRVVDVDPINMTATLSAAPQISFDRDKHPLLRRWDQKPRAGEKLFDEDTGTVKIAESQGGESEDDDNWITLEDGVQIQFPRLPNDPATYRPGDYWLIPARTITGDVEWPQKPDPAGKLPAVAVSLSPHGVEHHYAPLADFQLVRGNIQGNIDDLRGLFKSLVELS